MEAGASYFEEFDEYAGCIALARALDRAFGKGLVRYQARPRASQRPLEPFCAPAPRRPLPRPRPHWRAPARPRARQSRLTPPRPRGARGQGGDSWVAGFRAQAFESRGGDFVERNFASAAPPAPREPLPGAARRAAPAGSGAGGGESDDIDAKWQQYLAVLPAPPPPIPLRVHLL